jgi:hypothetical protein
MSPVLQLGLMLVFGGACLAMGDFLAFLFLSRTKVRSPIGRITLAFTVGNVGYSYLLSLLGFLGLFSLPTLWVVFLGGVGFGGWRMVEGLRRSSPPAAATSGSFLKDPGGFGGGEETSHTGPILLALVLAIFYAPVLVQTMAPPYMRDSLVYHLLCPKEYLAAGRIFHIEGNLYSAFPKGHEVLMTLLLAVAGDRAAQGFSLLQQMASIGAVYTLTRMMVRPWTAVLCTLGYATVPPAVYFSGCGYV